MSRRHAFDSMADSMDVMAHGWWLHIAMNEVARLYGDIISVEVPSATVRFHGRVIADANVKTPLDLQPVDTPGDLRSLGLVPDDVYLLLCGMCCCLARDNPQIAAAEIDLEFKPPLGTFSSLGCPSILRTSGTQSLHMKFSPFMIVPPGGAARLVGTPTLDNTELVGFVEAIVATKIGTV